METSEARKLVQVAQTARALDINVVESARLRSCVVRGSLGYTLAYPRWFYGEEAMQKTAKLFMNNRSQAVRLPKEFQFQAKEVYIRKEGSDVILSPRPGTWAEYFANHIPVSDEFVKIIENMEDPPPEDKDLF
jgi:antitoxin VapB